MTENQVDIIPAQLPKVVEKTRELGKIGQETLLALLQSKTNGEAAKRLSISESMLYVRINKYGLREKIAEFPKEALMRLQLGSTRAADVFVEELEDRRMQHEAAKEVLDRVGLVAKEKRTDSVEMKDGDRSITFKITRGE